MREVSLGQLRQSVSALGLGCMGMSWIYEHDRTRSEDYERVIARAVELGVTFFDTADVYGPFHNERLLARGLRGSGEDVSICTKGGLVSPDPQLRSKPDGSPTHLVAALDASLQRLGVEYVDLYLLHRVDPKVPLSESWGALSELVRSGKARQIGLCEVDVDHLEEAATIHPVAAVQSEFSLWTRQARDHGILEWCQRHDSTFIAFAPLGRGYLTGAIDEGSSFNNRDFRASNPRFTREARMANRRIVGQIEAVAKQANCTVSQVSLAWILHQAANIAAIPGTTSVKHLEENVKAERVDLTVEQLDMLESAPAAVGSRY